MKSFFIFLLCTGLLLQTVKAQYQKAYDHAIQFEKKQDFYKAIITYTAASIAPDKPKDNDIAERIDYCADKLNQLITEADSAKTAAEKASRDAITQSHRSDSLYKVAKEMQQKVETAMLDRAIKDHSPGWKSFAKYSRTDPNSDSTKKILNEVDSLDLSDNALLRIPKDVVKCPNLKYINLFGNPDIDWKESEKTLKNLNNDVGIYVSVTDLSEIDSSYWHLITGVEILSDTLKHIPQNILQQKQLKCLILDKNELDSLPPEIGSLTNLRKLSLFRNKLRILPVEIGKLIQLTQLVLQENQLTTLPPEIGMLKNLNELNLNNNSLTTLPVEIGSLTKLTTLFLYYNHLNILPNEIGGLKNLSYLDVERNKLYTLPSEIWELTNLTTLNLSENLMVRLPNEIGNLSKLHVLALYHNRLSNLPDEIWNLNKLSFLNLGENHLTELPHKIGKLTNLNTLGLRNTGLTTLPAEIGKLTKLSEFSLEGNYNISGKINVLQEMSNLIALYIDFKLFKLNSEGIAKLNKLTSLYLWGNEFSTIQNAIKELPSLTTLYLIGYTGDSLVTIPAEISELTNLTKLGLNMISINQLPPEIGTLTNLKHIDLMDTKIKSIPIELFNLNLADDDFFEIAQKLYKAKNYEQALQSYLKCIEIDSTYADAYGNIGLCYRMQGKPEKALTYLNKDLSFKENNVWCLNQLSYTYAALDSAARAFEYAEKSNRIKISPDVWFETGNQLSKVKNYEQALKSYLRSIDLDGVKTNYATYSNAGFCCGKLGKPKKALEYYRSAYSMLKNLISIDSNNYHNWYSLSFYCLFVGQITEGIAAALRSLDLSRDTTGVLTNLVLGYVLNNQYDKAKPLYLEWKDKKFPNDERYAKELFLRDIEDLEDANIRHPDFEKVRDLLKE